MRLRKKPGVREKLLRQSQLVFDEQTELKGGWSEIFGNNNPLYVELGTGKGNFISTMAQKYPQINFIGVEKVPEVLNAAVKKILPLQLGNIRLLLIDINMLTSFFLPGEVHRFYLNFSDPWPKTRHAKRRLTNRDFLEIYKGILHKEGQVHLKTDNLVFFEYSLSEFVEVGFSLQKITYNLHQEGLEENVQTEYEQKFSSLGKPICRCEAFKNH